MPRNLRVQYPGAIYHVMSLMPNHCHLVVEPPQPTVMAGMKWLLGTYTGRFNRWHQQPGHLFSGRYKSLIVEGSGSERSSEGQTTSQSGGDGFWGGSGYGKTLR
jgi:REP element-mobilizing transposase RayT